MTTRRELSQNAGGVLEFDAIKALVGRFTRTSLGRLLAARIQPARDIERARYWLAMAEEMRRWLEQNGAFPIQGACEIRPLLGAARDRGSPLEGRELRQIADCLEAACRLRDLFGPLARPMPAFAKLMAEMPDEGELRDGLVRAIDARGEVVGEPGGKLAELRARLDVLKDRAYRRAEALCRVPEIRPLLRESLPSVRNERLVLVVRAECRGQVRGIYHDRSASGATVYVEPEVLVDLQNEIQDLLQAEQREVVRILWAFTRLILERRDSLSRTQDLLAAADFTYGRACFARAFGATIPQLVEKGALRLRGARHPLLMEMAMAAGTAGEEERRDRAFRDVVPFDLDLGDSFDVLVITGPNTGGKTVLLKSTGLIALMALSGIPVTCEGATSIPFYREVVADIGDEQSIHQSLSTFSSHMQRIAGILRVAGSQSLVLLDELGAGTDPVEGEALGHAILRDLVERGVPTLVTTHLGRLKQFAASTPRAENGSVEFDPESLRPTYHLTIGLPGESNALKIARGLGLPRRILAEAERKLSEGRGRAAELMESVQRVRRTVQERLREAEREADEVRRQRLELEQRIAEVEAKARLARDEADRSIDTCLRRARAELEAALRELGTVPAHLVPGIERLERQVAALLQASPLAEKRRRYVKTLRRDDKVWLPKYRETCRVRRIDLAAEQLQVTYRNLLVTVPFDEVGCPEDFDAGSIEG
ncbi:MAG: hypothetical protein AB1486_29200 [Planctomycetota bacterium]